MRRTVFAAYVAFAACAFASSRALADVPTEGRPAAHAGTAGTAGTAGDAAKEAARERFKKGVKLYDAAEAKNDPALYESAYLEFAQAYAVYPDEVVLWNLAVSELDTKRFVDALRHLREYDRTHPSLAPEKRAELRRNREKAASATGHLAIEAPSGAHVLVDDKDVGAAPLLEPIDATPGRHRVATEGQAGRSLEVNAAAGEVTRVRLVGDDTSMVAAASTPVVVSTSALVPAMGAGMPVDEASASHPFWTTRRTAGAVAASAGAAALAAGIVFALHAQADRDDAAAVRASLSRNACRDATTPGCSDLGTSYDALDRDRALSAVFLTAGATALAAGAALVLWPDADGKRQGRASVAPVFSPTGAGLELRGAL
jgi:hypothetical protein